MKPKVGTLKKPAKLTNLKPDGLNKRRLKLLKIRNESGDIFADCIEIKHKSTVNICLPPQKKEELRSLDEMIQSP